MTQLMLGNCTGTFHVHFAVPADQAEAFATRLTEQPPGSTPPEADDPVVVTGMGAAGTTIVPSDWLGQVLAGQHGTVEVDVIGCDPATGGFVTDPIPVPVPSPARSHRIGDPDHTRARPPTPTARRRPCRHYVKARDQRCRFPGCTTSAYFTDLDHVRPWPTGPTRPDNLACLCRRHHRIKQRPGWTVRLNPDGSMDWTDPTGRIRTTLPVDHLGTTLPAARSGGSQPAPPILTDRERGPFGDATWDGNYHDPDAYTGGIPIWLEAERDLAAARDRMNAAPQRRRLHPEQHSPVERALTPESCSQLGDPMSRNQPPKAPAKDIRWRRT